MILNIKYISASYCAGCCSIFVRLFSSFVLLRRKQKLIIDPTSVLDPSKGSFCKTTFSRKMKDFIKLALIAMLVYREILPSCMTIANETYKSISSISFFNQYKAEKTQIQQCKKIMDSALDEINFLQDFEGKRNVTLKRWWQTTLSWSRFPQFLVVFSTPFLLPLSWPNLLFFFISGCQRPQLYSTEIVEKIGFAIVCPIITVTSSIFLASPRKTYWRWQFTHETK